MQFKNLKYFLSTLFTFSLLHSNAQTAWPSKTWNNALNISSALPSDATELSGLYWNDLTSRLYCVGDGGSLYVLQYNKTTGQYTLIGSATSIGAPEGITMVNNTANEFYTIDEGSYEIRKYSHNYNFSNITKSNTWNLLKSPSPMTDTGNDGPEGIAFVPDWYLQKIGFISSATGQTYISSKGMGGLLFLAHQKGGSVWVYDVNPTVNQDLVFVGNYLTNRAESCEVAFDSSTGLLYILHNIDDNYLEVTDLTTEIVGGKFKLRTLKEYLIPNPTSNANVEGFAISFKYPEEESKGVWLCRDVKKDTEIVDALRWFNPYQADGNNIRTGIINIKTNVDLGLKFNVKNNSIHIESQELTNQLYSIKLYNLHGSILNTASGINLPVSLNTVNYQPGIYLLHITDDNQNVQTFKLFITN
jgi:hypothetical protein